MIITINGPLRYCTCGHGEHEHQEWLFACSQRPCHCISYVRDRKRKPWPGPVGEPRP